jgi:hypothetical protein
MSQQVLALDFTFPAIFQPINGSFKHRFRFRGFAIKHVNFISGRRLHSLVISR